MSKRPRMLLAAPRGLLLTAFAACLVTPVACTGPDGDALPKLEPHLNPDLDPAGVDGARSAPTAMDTAYLCCRSDTWQYHGCVGPAEFVGTVAAANDCMADAGKLLSCPVDARWTCLGALGDDPPQVCGCGTLFNLVDHTDEFSFRSSLVAVSEASSMASAVEQPICCDTLEAGVCSTPQAHFRPARNEVPRGALGHPAQARKMSACEATGGIWATCLAPRWRCERGDGDDAPLECRCDAMPSN